MFIFATIFTFTEYTLTVYITLLILIIITLCFKGTKLIEELNMRCLFDHVYLVSTWDVLISSCQGFLASHQFITLIQTFLLGWLPDKTRSYLFSLAYVEISCVIHFTTFDFWTFEQTVVGTRLFDSLTSTSSLTKWSRINASSNVHRNKQTINPKPLPLPSEEEKKPWQKKLARMQDDLPQYGNYT